MKQIQMLIDYVEKIVRMIFADRYEVIKDDGLVVLYVSSKSHISFTRLVENGVFR